MDVDTCAQLRAPLTGQVQRCRAKRGINLRTVRVAKRDALLPDGGGDQIPMPVTQMTQQPLFGQAVRRQVHHPQPQAILTRGHGVGRMVAQDLHQATALAESCSSIRSAR